MRRLAQIGRFSVENEPAEYAKHMPVVTLRFLDASISSAEKKLVRTLHLT